MCITITTIALQGDVLKGATELAPGWSTAAWCGRDAVPPEQAADRGRGDPMAKLEQLTLNTAITPARVLAGQAKDQIANLIWNEWSTSPRAPLEDGPAPDANAARWLARIAADRQAEVGPGR